LGTQGTHNLSANLQLSVGKLQDLAHSNCLTDDDVVLNYTVQHVTNYSGSCVSFRCRQTVHDAHLLAGCDAWNAFHQRTELRLLRERALPARVPRHHVLLQSDKMQQVRTAESQRGSSTPDSRNVVSCVLFTGDITRLGRDQFTPASAVALETDYQG